MENEIKIYNNYGKLKPFISNKYNVCNWIPLSDDISVEYNPNLTIRISNFHWKFTEKDYNEIDPFLNDTLKYNLIHNKYFDIEKEYLPFEIPNKTLELNLIKYYGKNNYNTEESIVLHLSDEFPDEFDCLSFIFALQKLMNLNEDLRDNIGKNSIFIALIENKPGIFDLILDSRKKSFLDKIKDNMRKILVRWSEYNETPS